MSWIILTVKKRLRFADHFLFIDSGFVSVRGGRCYSSFPLSLVSGVLHLHSLIIMSIMSNFYRLKPVSNTPLVFCINHSVRISYGRAYYEMRTIVIWPAFLWGYLLKNAECADSNFNFFLNASKTERYTQETKILGKSFMYLNYVNMNLGHSCYSSFL